MDERNIFSSVSHFSSGATPASPSWWSGCWTPTTPRRASGARPTPPSSRRTRPPGPGSSGSGPRTRTRDPADRSSTPSRRGPTRYLRINSFGDFFFNFSFINHRSTTLGSTASTRRPGTSSRPRNSPGRADRYGPHSFGYQRILQPANIFEMKLLTAVSQGIFWEKTDFAECASSCA